MNATDAFFDTNVLLYVLSADATKANQAETLLASGGTISVQVLNEMASVASRKLGMPVAEIREVLAVVRAFRLPAHRATRHRRGGVPPAVL